MNRRLILCISPLQQSPTLSITAIPFPAAAILGHRTRLLDTHKSIAPKIISELEALLRFAHRRHDAKPQRLMMLSPLLHASIEVALDER